jgi:hypothetical protein
VLNLVRDGIAGYARILQKNGNSVNAMLLLMLAMIHLKIRQSVKLIRLRRPSGERINLFFDLILMHIPAIFEAGFFMLLRLNGQKPFIHYS